MATDNLVNILKGVLHKNDLVLNDVVLGMVAGNPAEYFVYDKQRPELVVTVKGAPWRNVTFDNLLIHHYYSRGIGVTVEGASKEGILYIERAFKKIDEMEIPLVGSTQREGL
jgi:hypothetical protein